MQDRLDQVRDRLAAAEAAAKDALAALGLIERELVNDAAPARLRANHADILDAASDARSTFGTLETLAGSAGEVASLASSAKKAADFLARAGRSLFRDLLDEADDEERRRRDAKMEAEREKEKREADRQLKLVPDEPEPPAERLAKVLSIVPEGMQVEPDPAGKTDWDAERAKLVSNALDRLVPDAPTAPEAAPSGILIEQTAFAAARALGTKDGTAGNPAHDVAGLLTALNLSGVTQDEAGDLLVAYLDAHGSAPPKKRGGRPKGKA